MKTKEQIEYEINFLEQEIINRDFSYLKIEEMKTWLVALKWTLVEGEDKE